MPAFQFLPLSIGDHELRHAVYQNSGIIVILFNTWYRVISGQFKQMGRVYSSMFYKHQNS